MATNIDQCKESRKRLADSPKARTTLNHRVDALRELARNIMSVVDLLADVQYLDMERGINLADEVERFEVGLINRALKLTAGQQMDAAELLGISASTLHSKIKRYKIDPDAYKQSIGERQSNSLR